MTPLSSCGPPGHPSGSPSPWGEAQCSRPVLVPRPVPALTLLGTGKQTGWREHCVAELCTQRLVSSQKLGSWGLVGASEASIWIFLLRPWGYFHVGVAKASGMSAALGWPGLIVQPLHGPSCASAPRAVSGSRRGSVRPSGHCSTWFPCLDHSPPSLPGENLGSRWGTDAPSPLSPAPCPPCSAPHLPPGESVSMRCSLAPALDRGRF